MHGDLTEKWKKHCVKLQLCPLSLSAGVAFVTEFSSPLLDRKSSLPLLFRVYFNNYHVLLILVQAYFSKIISMPLDYPSPVLNVRLPLE